ncbi:MAG: InlB B-repeat-containing protein [Treponema sp.]|jgi:uncharacterized repeat protein (TIGR02543 family)|nr:InlB B-repeat-containing protein [Treponema sp.]
MKNRNIFSVFILIFVILGLFASCEDPTKFDSTPGGPPPTSYIVNFSASGGTPAPNPQTIAAGGKVVIPPAMTKTSYGFGGWYKEAACINQWNFDYDTVIGNITLYAMWYDPESTYTVTFNANGGSPAPNPQFISYYFGRVVMPPAMTKTGYGFVGWYKEAACINQWNFGYDYDIVSSNITLYAKWDVAYTVTFNADGGTPPPLQQTIINGGKVSEPNIAKEGYTLQGWYKEASCINLWDFTTDTVISNTILYAKWGPPIVVSGNTLAAKLQWLSTHAASNSGYILEVTAAYEELTPQNLSYPGKNNITIQLKGIGNSRVIALSGSRSLFSIGNGVTLILEENLILQGNVSVNGNLIMNQSVKITGNTSSGGGVRVSGGTFTMNGGEISGITSFSSDGGVVYVSGGTFTMNGGEISGNTSYYGGGVYVSGGTFTMSGGKISGNTSSIGGGVFVGSGTFTMNGGEISGNTANTRGGGVFGGTFTMSGGKISGNTSSIGGGVYVADRTFTMNGGEISGNTASSHEGGSGGGVYVDFNATFTMNGGEISGNTASSVFGSNSGGGVYVGSGTFTMNGGEISGNIASSEVGDSSGGGVYVHYNVSFFEKTGGTIYGYTAGNSKSNAVKNNSGVAQNDCGHAVYVSHSNSSYIKRKETTAGSGNNLSYIGRLTPPIWDGVWDF